MEERAFATYTLVNGHNILLENGDTKYSSHKPFTIDFPISKSIMTLSWNPIPVLRIGNVKLRVLNYVERNSKEIKMQRKIVCALFDKGSCVWYSAALRRDIKSVGCPALKTSTILHTLL
ncbi:hypothetical protein GcM1_247038 [Golovinomyces cichoracearum]|uniref:Uncharacterized protein n=1 Tax=Golovinomyces cichoracearum TaxID=62708 RepID=A0A420IDE5_9PEZI|nr:hypothetical protein GcM1_247038 [Golovinomyces cichoracearum]